MTHPDDEISICAWIKLLAGQHNVVHVSWTHSTAARESESRSVMVHLGVPPENLHFFNLPDKHVCDHLTHGICFFKELVELVKPDRIVTGAFEQGHVDHDSTNYLVNRCFSGPILEVPLYHTYHTSLQKLNRFSNPGGQEVRVLNEDERRLKIEMAQKYPTQSIWRVLVAYELWQRLQLRPARLWQDERMRLQTHKTFKIPNHPPHISRKVAGTPSWQRWQKALATVEDLSCPIVDSLVSTNPMPIPDRDEQFECDP